MTVRPLTLPQMQEIFERHMRRDFDAAELKPFSAIEALYRRGVYCGYGLYHAETLCAYAMFCKSADDGQFLLLDYYAVLPEYRSHGYGGVFLKLLRERFDGYAGILAEVERISAAKDEADRDIRIRRIAFYERNGLRRTEIHSTLFGVAFDILYFPCKCESSDAELLDALDAIYHTLFPAHVYQKNVLLTTGAAETDG